jgi:hypothetical protein
MSAAPPPAPAPVPVSRPTVADYFLLLTGFALTLFFTRLPVVAVQPNGNLTDAHVLAFVGLLPLLLRLTEGVVLLWPAFFSTQRLRGRKEPPTAAEGLWIASWLGVAIVNAVAVVDQYVPLPEFAEPYRAAVGSWPAFIWYAACVPVVAVLAAAVAAYGLVSRKPTPWTHGLALALCLWPVLPLLAALALGTLK